MTTFFLQDYERGRGVHLSPERLAEIKAYCLKRFREGRTQNEIVKEVGASRSRVSRWINSAFHENNLLSERRRIETRERTDIQRLFDRIDFQSSDQCWTWLGARKANGYGDFSGSYGREPAHRATYQFFVGSIPEGMEIDHACCNPSCVNPHHLQPVWPSENKKLAWVRRKANAA